MSEVVRHLPLLLSLLGLEALLAFLLRLLARALGRRLDLGTLLLAAAASVAILAPYLASSHLLVPTAALAEQVPGAAVEGPVDPFDRGLNDAVLQFFPWETEVRRAFAEGRLPLWSDRLDGGSDLWANLQAQISSPLALLARLAPLHHFLLVGLALRVLTAVAGATLLARALGVRRRWARLAGLSFGLGGGLVAWAVFPHGSAISWLPWAALGALRVARRADGRGTVATALATAALLVGGHPEVAAAGCGLAALLAVALAARRVGRARALARWLFAATLAFGLAAPQWLPLLAAVDGSERRHEQLRAGPAGEGSALGFGDRGARFLLSPLHPAPRPDGSPGGALPPGSRPLWNHQMSAYGGLAALAGLACLLAAPPRRRAGPLLFVFAVTLLGLADFAPLDRLERALPGLRLVEDSRFMPAGALALALLGAAGLERLARRREPRRQVLALSLAAAASLTAGPPGAVLAGWVAVALAASWAPRRPRLAAAFLLAALAVDLLGFGWRILPRGERRHFYPRTAFVERLAAADASEPGFRATGHDLLVYPSILAVYGLHEVRPYNPLAPEAQLAALRAAFDYRRQIDHYFSPLRRLDHPLLDFLGVRWVVTNAYLPPLAGCERIDSGEALPQPFELWRNPQALPRAFLAARADRIARPDLAAWIAGLDDGRRVALFADEAPPLPGPPGEGEVGDLQGRPGDLRLAVTVDRPAVLATSLPGPRGWRVTVDGAVVPALTINGAFLGALLPAGAHTVRLSYSSPGLAAGGLLAASAGALLLALAWGGRRSGDVG